MLIHASGGELGSSSKLGTEELTAVGGDKKRVREVGRCRLNLCRLNLSNKRWK